MKKTILKDPRYKEFLKRFHADPMRFAVEVTGFRPSGDQEELFDAITPIDCKVSVSSGTACFGKGTQMMRSNGESVAVEDIRVGDRLMGPDGRSVRNVLELKRGREALYRFTYHDGTSHVFNESHILCLEAGAKYLSRGKDQYLNVTVREWLSWPKTKQTRYYAYRSPVINLERESNDLPIPPYVFGVWLGDGDSDGPTITNPDVEVLEEWAHLASQEGCFLRSSRNSESCFNWHIVKDVDAHGRSNPVTTKLRSLGVLRNKHIPDAYKYSSYENRLELLAGLIDTDGHFDDGSGGYEFSQKNESIAKDVAWLARSIGCSAGVKKVRKQCVNNGVWGEYWRVCIGRNVELIPVRVERKKHDGRSQRKKKLIWGIKSVEPLGEGDYYGFVLDGDSRFLGADFFVLHNTGKTASYARIALWHLLAFPLAKYENKIEIGSNTYIGAPAIQQVSDGLWKEMQDTRIAIANGKYAWLNQYYTITKTRVEVRGYESQWFIAQVAMAKGQSVSIAGKHRYYQMIIVDEAAGVPDEHFDVINGTQTQPGNRTLLASQGVRNAGFFYNTHHEFSVENGGAWTNLTFSSERSPFVTEEWLKNREAECGGRNSVEYIIRVLGGFADNSSNNLLTRVELQEAFVPRRLIGDDEPYGLVVLADVGMGEYRDDSVATVAKIIGNEDHGPDARRVEIIEIPICHNDKNEIDFAGDVMHIVGKLSNATLYLDHGGIGHTVAKLIERSGGTVERVDWGKPCFKKAYRDRFANQRACAMVRFRDAVRDGRVLLPQGIPKALKEKIVGQGARIPYHFVESGGLKYQMARKEDMRADGIKSPDIIDTFAFAFLEQCTYVPSGGNAQRAEERRTRALDKAKQAFDDILS